MTPPFLRVLLLAAAHQGRPNSMVILTDYELVENPETGIFCEER